MKVKYQQVTMSLKLYKFDLLQWALTIFLSTNDTDETPGKEKNI